MGTFLVRRLGADWYIGSAQAAQRIEADRQWLDHWLQANGESDTRALDFDGSTALERAFLDDFGGSRRATS